MNDLRRIGKTMILRKMLANPPKDWIAIKRDLGGYHTAEEFATQVYRDSANAIGTTKKNLRRMEKLLGALKGTEIAGVLKLPDGEAAPWKEVLSRTFADINEEMDASGGYTVFLWDEVPFLLENVSKRQSAETAMEILDTLRSLGQDYSRIRLVLTGSIGLHHVLAEFREKGYVNSPLNHMERVAPGPLSHEDAADLARQLIVGQGIICDDVGRCADTLASLMGDVPFYIHKLITRLPTDQTLTSPIIEQTLTSEFAHSDNDWDLAHYRTRIPLYYDTHNKLAYVILDAVATRDMISFDTLVKEVAARIQTGEEEDLRRILGLLQQDHYLNRDPNGNYGFRFNLLRKWWLFDRSLKASNPL